MKLITKYPSFQLSLAVLTFVLLFCAEASSMLCGVDATSKDLIEDILNTPIPIALPGVPGANGEDGCARSATHYYYATNAGPNGAIYELDLTGALTNTWISPNSNFQGLGYVHDARGCGKDRVYGLDIIIPGLVELDPATGFTGTVYPIAGADRACAGGNKRLFVQIRLGTNRILEINPGTGAIINSFPTPNAGTVLFDGLAFDGSALYGSEVVYPDSDIWKMDPNTGAPSGTVTVNYWFASLGADAGGPPWSTVYGQMFKSTDSKAALPELRLYRDDILMASTQGKELVSELYEEHSAEMAKILLANPRLMARGALMVKKHLPGIKKALNGGKMEMTRIQIAQVSKLLGDIAKTGSPELKAYIASVQKALKGNLAPFGVKVVKGIRAARAPGLKKDNLTTTWGAIKHSVQGQ